VAANLAAGTLFAWSLVAQDAADGVGMSRRAAAGVFATAIVVFAAVVLAVGPAERRWRGPSRRGDGERAAREQHGHRSRRLGVPSAIMTS
jgi:hypothetical protein